MILHDGSTSINDLLGNWLSHRLGVRWGGAGTGVCFGYWADATGSIGGVACCRSFNGTSLYVDIALDVGFFPKSLIRVLGDYAFLHLKAKSMTLVTDSTNLRAQRLHKALGAERVAVVPGVAKGGADSIISVLLPEKCVIWRKLSGQGLSTESPGLHGTGQPAGAGQPNGGGQSNGSQPHQPGDPDGVLDLEQ